MDRFLHGFCHRQRIALGLQLNDHQAVARNVLRIRKVKEWPSLAATEKLKLSVACNTDHFQFAILLGNLPERVSHWILVRPVLPRHAFADYGHIPSLFIVSICECAAPHQIDAHGLKILRRHHVIADTKIRRIGRRRSPVDHNRIATNPEVAHRHRTRMAHRLNSHHLVQTVKQIRH